MLNLTIKTKELLRIGKKKILFLAIHPSCAYITVDDGPPQRIQNKLEKITKEDSMIFHKQRTNNSCSVGIDSPERIERCGKAPQ